MKKFLLLAVLIYACLMTEAQIDTPQASPEGSVSTSVGLTTVKIDYYRPRTKGRKIFGTEPTVVVPFGKIWRTGANNGTKISFSADVKVEGIAVPKGEYLILTWPGATEWTVSLYKDIELGGSVDGYDAAKDAAKFKVKAEKLTEKVDQLTFTIGDLSEDNRTSKVQLAWENTSVKFSVYSDYDARVVASIEKTMTVSADDYFSAAVYYLESGKDLKKALEWITIATDREKDAFWMSYQKARIQKALGDKTGAVATAKVSIEAAKKANNTDYQRMNDDLIKSVK